MVDPISDSRPSADLDSNAHEPKLGPSDLSWNAHDPKLGFYSTSCSIGGHGDESMPANDSTDQLELLEEALKDDNAARSEQATKADIVRGTRRPRLGARRRDLSQKLFP